MNNGWIFLMSMWTFTRPGIAILHIDGKSLGGVIHFQLGIWRCLGRLGRHPSLCWLAVDSSCLLWQSPGIHWIGLRENFNRKAPYFMGKSENLLVEAPYLMGKSMVSCRFSQQNQSIEGFLSENISELRTSSHRSRRSWALRMLCWKEFAPPLRAIQRFKTWGIWLTYGFVWK